MYIGLDIGTSSVKAVLIDEAQTFVASRTAPLDVSRPHSGWSEQDAESWWTACEGTLDAPLDVGLQLDDLVEDDHGVWAATRGSRDGPWTSATTLAMDLTGSEWRSPKWTS